MIKDEMNFEDVYQKLSDKVYGYIYLMIGEAETAEDLTQETFLKIYKNMSSYRGQSTISTWVIAIARNKTIDYIRRKKRLSFFSLLKTPLIAQSDTPLEILEKGEAVVELYKVINQLKLDYKEVLILRKIKELSIRETAYVLGWEETKVKVITSRALAALKEKIHSRKGYFSDESSG
ncbi:RNA polymerase sigma factor [Sutcliffiella horikoshii]|uniref:RNA polymerase sigma factor n=1 Tax=Sutcliffiella horikoshii TaxID=79883 RepID=UPI0038510952